MTSPSAGAATADGASKGAIRARAPTLGAAAVQLGPRAPALAADLNKGLGLSFGKVSRLFQTFFGIAVSRAGLCRALHRVARVAAPTYGAFLEWIRQSAPVVTADETGWKVGGRLQWLWVFHHRVRHHLRDPARPRFR